MAAAAPRTSAAAAVASLRGRRAPGTSPHATAAPRCWGGDARDPAGVAAAAVTTEAVAAGLGTSGADGAGSDGDDDVTALSDGGRTIVDRRSPTESASDWSSSSESSGSAVQNDSNGRRPRSLRRSRPFTLTELLAQPAANDDDAAAVATLRDLEDLPVGPIRDAATAATLHAAAVRRGRDQYVDVSTGYKVWTAVYLGRRSCCGNGCRHCPYEHANVPKRE